MKGYQKLFCIGLAVSMLWSSGYAHQQVEEHTDQTDVVQTETVVEQAPASQDELQLVQPREETTEDAVGQPDELVEPCDDPAAEHPEPMERPEESEAPQADTAQREAAETDLTAAIAAGEGSSFETAIPLELYRKYSFDDSVPPIQSTYLKYTAGDSDLFSQPGWAINKTGQQYQNQVSALIHLDPNCNNNAPYLDSYNSAVRFYDPAVGLSFADVSGTFRFDRLGQSDPDGVVTVEYRYMQDAMSKQSRMELKSGTKVLGYVMVNPSYNCGLSIVGEDASGAEVNQVLEWGAVNQDGNYLEKLRWYDLKFVLDFNQHTIAAYCNGALKATVFFLDAAEQGLSEISFSTRNDSATDFYVDDLVITSGNSVVYEMDFELPDNKMNGWHTLFVENYIGGGIEVYDGNYQLVPPVAGDDYYLENGTYYIKVGTGADTMYSISFWLVYHPVAVGPVYYQQPTFYAGISDQQQISTLTSGFVTEEITLNNEQAEAQEIFLVIGLYENHYPTDMLVDVAIIRKILPPHSAETFAAGFNVPEFESRWDYSIKTIVWDNPLDMNQLCPSYEF